MVFGWGGRGSPNLRARDVSCATPTPLAPPPPQRKKAATLKWTAFNSTKTAFQKALAPVLASGISKQTVLVNDAKTAINSTKSAVQSAVAPVLASEINKQTVLVNDAKTALNSTKAAVQSAVAPVLVPKIGEKYNDIIAV